MEILEMLEVFLGFMASFGKQLYKLISWLLSKNENETFVPEEAVLEPVVDPRFESEPEFWEMHE